MYEYRVVDSVDEANRLALDGFEIFYIVAQPAGNGAQPRDHLYLRREARRNSATGFVAGSTGTGKK